jgi:hypothetical protein
MQLLASWRDSLTIFFKLSNLKLFCLVTLKSLVESYKVWLKYWGWLLVVLCLFLIWKQPVITPAVIFVFGFADVVVRNMVFTDSPEIVMADLIGTGLVIVSIITLFLSVRPSMMLKTYAYFFSYYAHAVYTVLWFVLISSVWAFIMSLLALSALPGISTIKYLLMAVGMGISLFLVVCIPSMTLFYIYFLYDTDGSCVSALQSVRRAFLMFVYNVPFCCLAGLIIVLLCGMIFLLAHGMVIVFGIRDTAEYYGVITTFKVLFFMPVIANGANNFYLKRLHEQFNLYFE